MDFRIPSALAVGVWSILSLFTLSYTVDAYNHGGGIGKQSDLSPTFSLKLPAWLKAFGDFTSSILTDPAQIITGQKGPLGNVKTSDGKNPPPDAGSPSILNQVLPDPLNNLLGIK